MEEKVGKVRKEIREALNNIKWPDEFRVVVYGDDDSNFFSETKDRYTGTVKTYLNILVEGEKNVVATIGYNVGTMSKTNDGTYPSLNWREEK